MKCPKCRSGNVSVHVRNRNRVWCRQCGIHFDCDFEIEALKASVSKLLVRVERLIEAQKPKPTKTECWQCGTELECPDCTDET